MKLRLLEFIRCPACLGRLRLDDATGPDEVLQGMLGCTSCRLSYPVRDGIPRLIRLESRQEAHTTRTSVRFGYLWAQTKTEPSTELRPYHFEKMAQTLGLDEPAGLVLDAGCGEGIDLANHARRPSVEVIGVELSEGGCRTSAARVRSFANAHVVQADLRRLPFADGTFDRIYSYGVLHHVVSPPAAAAELARVSRPDAEVAIYLYEDFGERTAAMRASLAVVNSFRAVTTRLPPSLLYAMCQAGSPIVYTLLTIPSRVFRRIPGLTRLAASMPFRHGRGPFALAGDLYDRFSAPIEYRYSRRSSADLLGSAGLAVTKLGYERGWMVAARRPAPQAAARGPS